MLVTSHVRAGTVTPPRRQPTQAPRIPRAGRQHTPEAGAAGPDHPAGRRQPAIGPDKIKAVVDATLQTTPPAATHWSVRTMAKAQGLGHTTIHRIWRQHGLQPHRVETFKLSKDPRFVEKLRDVVGLYLAPPEHALVLSVDEKSQIQALDRTAP